LFSLVFSAFFFTSGIPALYYEIKGPQIPQGNQRGCWVRMDYPGSGGTIDPSLLYRTADFELGLAGNHSLNFEGPKATTSRTSKETPRNVPEPSAGKGFHGHFSAQGERRQNIT
jgi:hypothetical protein